MGKRKKKDRNLGPRRKRMRRPARLMAAVKWRAGYAGKNIVRGYRPRVGSASISSHGRASEPELDGDYRRQRHPPFSEAAWIR
jgi:hypothetical protein